MTHYGNFAAFVIPVKPSIPRTLFTSRASSRKFQQYTSHAAGRLASKLRQRNAHFCINVWGSHCFILINMFYPLPVGEGRGEGIKPHPLSEMALPYSISEVPKYFARVWPIPRRFHGDPENPVLLSGRIPDRNVFTRVVSTGPGRITAVVAVRIRMSSSRSRDISSGRRRRTVPDPQHNRRRRDGGPRKIEVNEVGEDDGVITRFFHLFMVASNSASRPVAFTFLVIPHWRRCLQFYRQKPPGRVFHQQFLQHGRCWRFNGQVVTVTGRWKLPALSPINGRAITRPMFSRRWSALHGLFRTVRRVYPAESFFMAGNLEHGVSGGIENGLPVFMCSSPS